MDTLGNALTKIINRKCKTELLSFFLSFYRVEVCIGY